MLRVAGLLGLSCAFACVPSQTQFGDPRSFPAGYEPSTGTPVDVNGDGKTDLVVTGGYQRGSILVMLGRGDGTLDKAWTISGSGHPHYSYVTDVNGDGKPDLVVNGLVDGGFLSVLLGRGDGTFATPSMIPIGPDGTSAKAADFNGDGKVDLVVLHGQADAKQGKVTILLGLGDGNFIAPMVFPIGRAPTGVGIGDFNGDGKLDLSIPDELTRVVYLLLGHGDGTFTEAERLVPGLDPVSSPAVVDINHDGHLDLVVGLADGFVIYLGTGDGSFVRGATYVTERTRSVWAVDFNRDGYVDLVAAHRVFRGNGTGLFTPFALEHLPEDDTFMAAGDFNGDGWPDLAATDAYHNQVNIYLNRGPMGGGGGPASTTSRERVVR